MSIGSRLDKLERQHTPAERPVRFVLVEPPPGLSRAEHAAWLAERAKDGQPHFTLDLEAASAARVFDEEG